MKKALIALCLLCIVCCGFARAGDPIRDWVNSWRPGILIPLPTQRPPTCQPIPLHYPIYQYPPAVTIPFAPAPACPGGQCPIPKR